MPKKRETEVNSRQLECWCSSRIQQPIARSPSPKWPPILCHSLTVARSGAAGCTPDARRTQIPDREQGWVLGEVRKRRVPLPSFRTSH